MAVATFQLGAGGLQGGALPIQGSNRTIQGTSPVLQSGTNAAQSLQPTVAPTTGQTLYSPSASAAPAGGGTSTYDAAAAAAAAATAKATADFNNLKNATYGTINNSVSSGATNFNSGILDYLDARRQQQNGINNSAVQNEVKRQVGTRGVLDLVGHGIRSGGVILANGNASDSSAGEALARAYGDIGQRQQAGVNGDYAEGENTIQQQEGALQAGDTTQARHNDENKANIVNTIVNDATQKLSALNQSAAYASLPDRINIEQEATSIRAQALAALQQYDQVLSQGLSTQAPTSVDANRASAAGLLAAGNAPRTDYTPVTPQALSGTGPFASELPIFTNQSAKKKTA